MEIALRYGFQVLGAIVILVVGFLVARWLGGVADQRFQKQQMEPPMRILLVRVIKILVLIMAVLVALDKFGFSIAPLVAGIGVAGIGVGFALQGVLSNLMAGLTIIFTKPFRVGEYIEINNVHGDVTDDRALHHDAGPGRPLAGHRAEQEDRRRDPAQLRHHAPADPDGARAARDRSERGVPGGEPGGDAERARAQGPRAERGHRVRGRQRDQDRGVGVGPRRGRGSPPSPSSTSRSSRRSAPSASAPRPAPTTCAARGGRLALRRELLSLRDGLRQLAGPGRVERLEALEDLAGVVHAAQLDVGFAEILERFGEVRLRRSASS